MIVIGRAAHGNEKELQKESELRHGNVTSVLGCALPQSRFAHAQGMTWGVANPVGQAGLELRPDVQRHQDPSPEQLLVRINMTAAGHGPANTSDIPRSLPNGTTERSSPRRVGGCRFKELGCRAGQAAELGGGHGDRVPLGRNLACPGGVVLEPDGHEGVEPLAKRETLVRRQGGSIAQHVIGEHEQPAKPWAEQLLPLA